MKIALSTDATDLDGQLHPNFGRCRHFLIVDPQTGAIEVVANPGHGAPGGAGVQAARALTGRGIARVVSGRVGPNARPILEQDGIQVVENRTGPLKALLEVKGFQEAGGILAPGAEKPSAGGVCFCENCGYRNDDAGLPCFTQRCPRCGTRLERRLRGQMD